MCNPVRWAISCAFSTCALNSEVIMSLPEGGELYDTDEKPSSLTRIIQIDSECECVHVSFFQVSCKAMRTLLNLQYVPSGASISSFEAPRHVVNTV